METWMMVWTLVWYISLFVFSLLSIAVIIFGGHDLVALLNSLRIRHGEAQTLIDDNNSK